MSITVFPSNESGTDHPGTASDCGGEANNVFYADTYFNSTFDSGGTHRALVIDNTFAAYTVLSANTPDWDIVFLMVNTTMYGGTGGAFATFSRNQLSIEIALHEIGHSFAGLSDEYWAGFQFANENTNMTQDTNPSTVIWNQWLYDNGIGIYQYESPGNDWHRPHQDCKMRYLETPFCSVCSEHTIKTIYSITKTLFLTVLQKSTTFLTLITQEITIQTNKVVMLNPKQQAITFRQSMKLKKCLIWLIGGGPIIWSPDYKKLIHLI